MRSYMRKKAYQAHSTANTAAGMINGPEGGWSNGPSNLNKSQAFVRSGAMGQKYDAPTVRKRLTTHRRGPMLSMTERKIPRGKPEKACLCPARRTGVFAENERLYCHDCTGYCVE